VLVHTYKLSAALDLMLPLSDTCQPRYPIPRFTSSATTTTTSTTSSSTVATAHSSVHVAETAASQFATAATERVIRLFVVCMTGIAKLCCPVHLLCADLHFYYLQFTCDIATCNNSA
jgi:hypothetical protein